VPLPPDGGLRVARVEACLPRKVSLGLAFPGPRGRIQTPLRDLPTADWCRAQIAAGVVTAGRQGEATPVCTGLRHFYASWCINRRVDGGPSNYRSRWWQARLGHASIQMTGGTPTATCFPRDDDGGRAGGGREKHSLGIAVGPMQCIVCRTEDANAFPPSR